MMAAVLSTAMSTAMSTALSTAMSWIPLLAQEAQSVADAGREQGGVPLGLILVLVFLCVFIFTFVGFLLFSVGWESYEEKYLEGAERSLDDLFLTIPPQQMLWLQILSAAFGFVLFWMMSNSMGIGMVFMIGGFFMPKLALRWHKKKRAKKFGEQMVSALNTITNSLRTGFSLPKAFQLIASDMPKPICQEFGIVVQELRLGSDAQEALESLLERLPSQDLDLVVTSVAISADVGGNLAEVFDRISFTIRERRRIEGRIESLTAQGKMQGLLVSILPIFVGAALYWIDPALMGPMFETTMGQIVLAVMVVMECVGYFWIYKITNIEV